MKLQRLLLSAIAVSALAMALPAQAGYVEFSNLYSELNNQHTATVGSTTYTAQTILDAGGRADSLFGFKEVGGVTGLGVQGGASGNEIDFNGLDGRERVIIDFGGTTGLTGLTFGAIFNGPEYSDGNEIARIVASLADGTTITGVLRTQGDASNASARWIVNGVFDKLVDCSGMDDTGPGLCSIVDPFESSSITRLRFLAGNDNTPNNSDYTLVSMEVPEPAAIGLLGLGLLGLGAVIRRRRSV